jgi:lambda family phage portal protein
LPATVAHLPAAGNERADLGNPSRNGMGAFDGADRYDASFAMWGPQVASADADIYPAKQTIDTRSRDMLRNDAYIQGGANLHKDNIVGAHFLLNARPATRRLFGKEDDVWEEEFQAEVEELWELFAESPDCWVDAARANNLTQLVRMAVGIHLAAGEVLGTAEWDRQSASEFNTCIQMVDLDRLSTDPMSRTDPNVRMGIRYNSSGAPLAYQIRTTHPVDIVWNFTLPEWKEVPLRKPWGRLQVIHLKEQVRPAQSRGIPEMAAALKEMRMTHTLRGVNLQQAVAQAVFAAAITSELPAETVFQQLGGAEATPEQIQQAITSYSQGYLGAIGQYIGKARGLTIDGARIPHLYPGTKLEFLSPEMNPTQGTLFEQSLLRYLAAAIGVSYEQLSRDYTNTNYSSARAAMTETWKFMQSRKKLIADRFATITFRLWLEEAINKNKLFSFPKKKAGLLYSNGVLNTAFDAISRCEWIGASRGQIDELKETQAAVARIEAGISTREDELARLGKDWRKVFRQLEREAREAQTRNLVFTSNVAAATVAADSNGNADNQNGEGDNKKKAA